MITSSVAFGFILAHQRTLGADQAYYESLLDQAAAAGVTPAVSRIVLLGAARVLVGTKLKSYILRTIRVTGLNSHHKLVIGMLRKNLPNTCMTNQIICVARSSVLVAQFSDNLSL